MNKRWLPQNSWSKRARQLYSLPSMNMNGARAMSAKSIHVLSRRWLMHLVGEGMTERLKGQDKAAQKGDI